MSIVNIFFEHQLTVKMFHFQTKNYGGHKAADEYLEKYEANFDRFMEAFQGSVGKLNDTNILVKFNTVNDKTVTNHLNSMAKFLTDLSDLSVDLAAIRDEMVADIQQFKYLLMF